MRKTILLGVDARHYTPEATELARELSHDTGDKIIIVHVHEFAVGRFGRLQVDCPEDEAELLLPEIVSSLRDAGLTADAEIRETNVGHVARSILEAADEHDVRVIVLGSGGRTDLPHIPFGSVAHRLLHLARRPVLIVPRYRAASTGAQIPETAGQEAPETVAG
jgi:nucleotide-binding universal stress UspA family protein